MCYIIIIGYFNYEYICNYVQEIVLLLSPINISTIVLYMCISHSKIPSNNQNSTEQHCFSWIQISSWCVNTLNKTLLSDLRWFHSCIDTSNSRRQWGCISSYTCMHIVGGWFPPGQIPPVVAVIVYQALFSCGILLNMETVSSVVAY